MFVSDLRHFLDIDGDAPAPARRIAEQLSRVVRAATAADAGVAWLTVVGCTRRPARRPCLGRIIVFRSEVPSSIEWQCAACDDAGVISGWEGTPFDLSRVVGTDGSTGELKVTLLAEVVETLQTVKLLDDGLERVVWGAPVTDELAVLSADVDTFEELLDCVAAEANHEENRRRRRLLDGASDALQRALATT